MSVENQQAPSTQKMYSVVPLVEFVYLVFTCMPDESYCRRLGSLLLCLCVIF